MVTRPGRPFYNLNTSKSVVQRSWTTQISHIYGFPGSRIVKGMVREANWVSTIKFASLIFYTSTFCIDSEMSFIKNDLFEKKKLLMLFLFLHIYLYSDYDSDLIKQIGVGKMHPVTHPWYAGFCNVSFIPKAHWHILLCKSAFVVSFEHRRQASWAQTNPRVPLTQKMGQPDDITSTLELEPWNQSKAYGPFFPFSWQQHPSTANKPRREFHIIKLSKNVDP